MRKNMIVDPIREVPQEYRKMGGIESVLHGAEIKKTYSALRELDDLLMNFKYFGKYFHPLSNRPSYDLIHDRSIQDKAKESWEIAVNEMERLRDMLECYKKDMQYAKVSQEVYLDAKS